MSKLIILMVLAISVQSIHALEQTRKLLETVTLPIVVDGKNVGSMKIPAGEVVSVVSDNGTNAVIKRGVCEYAIASHSLEVAPTAATLAVPIGSDHPVVSSTPSSLPQPSRGATVDPQNKRASKGSLNLLPPIPNQESNPHFKKMFDWVHLGESRYGIQAQNEGEETLVVALAYLHPQSPLKGSQAALDRLLVLLDGRFSLWMHDKNLGDHLGAFESTYAYLALKTYAPDKIPAEKKPTWEEAIRRFTTDQISNNKLLKDHIAGKMLANSTIRTAPAVYFGSLALGDHMSAEIARSAFEDCIPKSLLGDGATHYFSYTNETHIYHHKMVCYAAWFYLFTGSQAIKNFLAGMAHYAPLTEDRGGFVEYSTAPAWKSFYTSGGEDSMALLEAYITGDPYNFTLGKDTTHPLLAFYYRPDLSGAELPDNFILYDRNVLGPRGRFGTWGVVGTSRDPSNPAPELKETPTPEGSGLNTFIGAYVLDENTRQLNAALHGAAPEVKIAAGEEKDWNRGEKWAYLTGLNCHNAVSKSNLIYGLSTRYQISRKGFDPNADVGWDGIQEWVFTPDRIIGLSSIYSTKTGTAYGLAQRIALVSSKHTQKPGNGKSTELQSLGDDTWSYGNLQLKTYSKEYLGKVESFYFSILADFKRFKDPDSTGSCMIVLHDEKSGTDTPTRYPSGTTRSVILEATHAGKKFSSDVAKLKLSSGLNGFEFNEDAGRKIRMVHNITSFPVEYSDHMKTPYGKARMIMSWDDKSLNPLTISSGSVTIPRTTIPPYENIVIVSSDIPEDHIPGFKDYEKVFTASKNATN